MAQGELLRVLNELNVAMETYQVRVTIVETFIHDAFRSASHNIILST